MAKRLRFLSDHGIPGFGPIPPLPKENPDQLTGRTSFDASLKTTQDGLELLKGLIDNVASMPAHKKGWTWNSRLCKVRELVEEATKIIMKEE